MSVILQHWRQRVEDEPYAVALSQGQQRLTRSQLMAAVTEIATRLSPYQGQVLALQADNQLDWVLVDLACLEAGIVLLPLPAFFSAGQQAHAIAQSGAVALIRDADGVSEPCAFPVTNRLVLTPVTKPALASLPESTVKITFTSGSTGNPKGVCLSEDNLLSVAQALLERTGLENSRHLCVLPLPTLLENVAGVYAALLSGGEVCLLPADELGFNGSSDFNVPQWLNVLDTVRPNSMILLPGLLAALISSVQQGWQAPDSLQFVAVGGSRVGSGLLQAAKSCGLPVYEGYGLSECASVVSLNSETDHKTGTAGKPLSHIQLQIDDGEIVVSGNPFLGYVNEPESWSATEVRTGDLGFVDEQGYLHIMGRRKNLLINSFGRNINPEWIESEVLANPAIAQCVVTGDAQPFCIALIYPRGAVEDELIDNWLQTINRDLPDYARIRQWLRLPRPFSHAEGTLTANGKPVRSKIDALYQSDISNLYKEQA